ILTVFNSIIIRDKKKYKQENKIWLVAQNVLEI
ncbi:unnamed protein product, partial [marine sediment metagenome]